MATKKLSTKVKSKTAKSTKTAKQSVATADTKSSSNDSKSHQLLHQLNILSGVVFVLLAVAVGVVMKATVYQLNVSHVTKDQLASQTETVLVPAIHGLYDVDLRWLLVALLALSAVVPILAVTKLHEKYHKMLKKGVQSLRWIDLAVTSAIAVEIVALTSGVQDIMQLKTIGGFMVLTALLFWLSERQNSTTKKPVWPPFVMGVVSFVLAWLVVGSSLLNTHIYGMVRFPWHVYAAAAALYTGYLLTVLNHYCYIRRFKTWANYQAVERNYLFINLFTKFALGSVLLSALMS